eukprot:g9095.t1
MTGMGPPKLSVLRLGLFCFASRHGQYETSPPPAPEDYNAQLQLQVADIENSKIGLLEEQPVRVNGIVTVGYEPESTSDDVPLFEAKAGQEIEILIREMGGWSYCRRIGDKTPGWLPADRIAELARLVADHEVGESEGLLNLKSGDMVEVTFVLWNRCAGTVCGTVAMHWKAVGNGNLGESHQLQLQFLFKFQLWKWFRQESFDGGKDCREDGTKTPSRRSRSRSRSSSGRSSSGSVIEKPDDVTEAKQLAMQHLQDLKEMKDGKAQCAYRKLLREWHPDKNPDKVKIATEVFHGWAQCCLWTGPQLPGTVERQIGWVTDAYLEDNRSEAMLASKWQRLVLQALEEVVTYAVQLETYLQQALRREHELSASQGARVFIVDAENPDWVWCRLEEAGRAEGWLPRNVLIVEPGEAPNKDLPEWIKVGEKARWWSNSQKQFCDVNINAVDHSARQVTAAWLQLLPCSKGAKELYQQLPDWVRPGSVAYWWSTSQHRVLPVQIRDVCSRTRQDGLRKALTFMGSAEFLQADLNIDDGMITPAESKTDLGLSAASADLQALGMNEARAKADFRPPSLLCDGVPPFLKVLEGTAVADAITPADVGQAGGLE